MNKNKKINKIEKIGDFEHQPGKLASDLKMNITKMKKPLEFEKFMIIFAEIWSEKQKLS